jgi:hypothetical protein
MRKELATFKALITGDASIRYIDKTPIKRTPGETTEQLAHSTKLGLHKSTLLM